MLIAYKTQAFSTKFFCKKWEKKMLRSEEVEKSQDLFAKNLRDLMEARNWGASELAEAVNMSRQMVYDILNQRRFPSTDTMDRIAGVFGVQVSDLFKAGGPDISPDTALRALSQFIKKVEGLGRLQASEGPELEQQTQLGNIPDDIAESLSALDNGELRALRDYLRARTNLRKTVPKVGGKPNKLR
jgi:transcriptional regulator with XRE-family HTH domain